MGEGDVSGRLTVARQRAMALVVTSSAPLGHELLAVLSDIRDGCKEACRSHRDDDDVLSETAHVSTR